MDPYCAADILFRPYISYRHGSWSMASPLETQLFADRFAARLSVLGGMFLSKLLALQSP